MNKLKKMSVALAALFLVACSNDASSTYYSETTEATETTAQETDSTEEAEDSSSADGEESQTSESDEEASDEGSTEGSTNGPSESSAGAGSTASRPAGSTVSIKSTDTTALEASPQGEIIQHIVSRDPALDPKAENYSYLLIEEDDGIYQLEVRLDNADGSVANLVALYRYDEDEDRVEKQNQMTGEFEELEGTAD